MAQADNVILTVPIVQLFTHLFTTHLNPCLHFSQVHFVEGRRVQCGYWDRAHGISPRYRGTFKEYEYFRKCDIKADIDIGASLVAGVVETSIHCNLARGSINVKTRGSSSRGSGNHRRKRTANKLVRGSKV